MNIPRVLREQVKEYKRAGFHVIDVEPRNGSHFMARFAEFPERPQILTKNLIDRRAVHNNIARYRRLAMEGHRVDH
jgi:hypothetical protein